MAYGLACSGDRDNHKPCHIPVYCCSLKLRRTCGNTQEFFICSLNRLSPVVNRNGRKMVDNTNKDIQGIYKQGLHKIVTEESSELVN